MLTSPNKPPLVRRLASPRLFKSPRSPQVISTETQYQLRVHRPSKKIENGLKKGVFQDGTEKEERSIIGRKISLRERAGVGGDTPRKDRLRIGLKIQQQSKGAKVPSRQQLALQIQYNQFAAPGKVQNQNFQKQLNKQEMVQRRIRRIRSSQSLSSQSSSFSLQLEAKAQTVKNENEQLKKIKTQTLIRLQSLEKIYFQEKETFLGETVGYQRQIECLIRRIEKNKNELGHIYTYPVFDPVKLVVNPIVEMEGESSQVKSIITPDLQFQELKQESRLRYGALKESEGKERHSETTGPSSRQQYGELDCL